MGDRWITGGVEEVEEKGGRPALLLQGHSQ